MIKLNILNSTMRAYDSDGLGLDQGCTGLGHDEVDGVSGQMLVFALTFN
jgi:hypothetical protein